MYCRWGKCLPIASALSCSWAAMGHRLKPQTQALRCPASMLPASLSLFAKMNMPAQKLRGPGTQLSHAFLFSWAKTLHTVCKQHQYVVAGFTCSAGIACNKLLAKVASAMNKPNQQTVVPPRCDVIASCACLRSQ